MVPTAGARGLLARSMQTGVLAGLLLYPLHERLGYQRHLPKEGRMTDQQELDAWLKRHKAHFEAWGIDEIAYMALANGFSREIVYPTLSHWAMDRKTHSKYSDREWYYVQRELESMDFLKSQWERLHRYNIGAD